MLFKKKEKTEKQERIEKKKPRYVKICPRCRSLNVKIGNQGGSAGVLFGAPTMYKCLDCGYVNYAFPEVDLNEEDNEDKKVKEE